MKKILLVAPEKEAYTIPNPAYPPATKPIILTEEQMKELLKKQLLEKQKPPR